MVSKNYVKSKINSISNSYIKEIIIYEIKMDQPKCIFNTLLNYKQTIIPFFEKYFEEDYMDAIEFIFVENMLDIHLDNMDSAKLNFLNSIRYFSTNEYNIHSSIFNCKDCFYCDECNNIFTNNQILKLNLIILANMLNKYDFNDTKLSDDLKFLVSNIASSVATNELLYVLKTSYIGTLINDTKWNVNIAKLLMTMKKIEYDDFYNILKYNNSILSAINKCNSSDSVPKKIASSKNVQAPPKVVSINTNNYIDMINTSNALQELHQMIGLDKVKVQLENLYDLLCFKKVTEKQLALPNINLNCIFQGNPGTGKTITAKLYSNILYDTGFIKNNKLVCVSASDLIAEFVGATAIKTVNVINDSLGGVLFIDEAYQLTPKGEKDFGRECIATLVREMTEHKNDLVIIFAGYKDEMKEFVEVNPGMKSRITNFIDFEDYSINELYEIFKLNVNKANLKISDNLEFSIKNIFKEKSNDKMFGNARFVENLFQDIILEHSKNIMTKIRNNDITMDDNSISVLTLEDIPNEYTFNTLECTSTRFRKL